MIDDLKNEGYDKEAEYFKKKERELIEKMRRKLEKEKADTADAPPA